MKKVFLLFLFIIYFQTVSVSQALEKRIALVVGNGAYRTSPLSNPVNDAKDVSVALKKCGFTVITALNVNRREMRSHIRDFGTLIKRGGVGLFYYAGHGVQVNGENYLVPIGAEIFEENEVDDECLKVSSVLRKMETAENGLNIIILDACRDNPFGRSYRTTKSGLAKMDAPTGSILAYATAPGSVASDGSGKNGLYTSKILNHILTPGLTVENFFKKVRIDVIQDSGKKQVPWTESSLTGDFYFAGVQKEAPVVVPIQTKPGFVTIQSNVKGARVQIEDWFEGMTDIAELKIPSGQYKVIISKPGYKTFETYMYPEPGRKKMIYANLIPEKISGQQGELVIETRPMEAEILFPDSDLAYNHGMKLAPGNYRVLVSKAGYADKELTIQIDSGEDKNIFIDLEQAKSIPAPVIPGNQIQKNLNDEISPGRYGTFTEPESGIEFIWVPAGCYEMGNDSGRYKNERPAHEVCITGFWMGKFEVTQKTWTQVMNYNPSNFKGEQLPVEQVSWDEAIKFTKTLSELTGRVIRLPSEAEWEYAARSAGKDHDIYAGSNHVNQVSWYARNSSRRTHKVGTKEPNSLGIYDMSGNVWEWCLDSYADRGYRTHQKQDPVYEGRGSGRVFRGGSYYDKQVLLACTFRRNGAQRYRNVRVGFRVVMEEF